MRHPSLRILVAVLIGVIAPLCCCQASTFAGVLCDGRQEVTLAASTCCHECSDERDSLPQRDSSNNDQQSPPGKCPSCPSCQGVPAGAGVKSEAGRADLDQQLHALATLALAVVLDLPPLNTHVATAMPAWLADPPFVRANRATLRWHCALTV